ncbi:hypothetical protein UNPA324_21880 [Bradyrhizobium sp. UNPA324]|nr:hypothetical protein UNPA324_21880 [Bradyrhizobium sp. UNPA324]
MSQRIEVAQPDDFLDRSIDRFSVYSQKSSYCLLRGVASSGFAIEMIEQCDGNTLFGLVELIA